MAPELRVVLGLSGIFVLLFVFMAGQIGTAAELAAKTLF
jgi:NADH-quinone oxidoreductase subunit N